jgi:hypothetical protein
MDMVEIRGNTYPHREALRAMGGKWNAAKQCWMVPADKADEARALVPAKACGTRPNHGRAPRVCKTCGVKINFGVYCGKCEFS